MDGAKRLTLSQHDRGYRYNRDSFILASFFEPRGAVTVADFCAGSGVVTALLAVSGKGRRFVALELSPRLAALARRNVSQSGAAGVEVIVGDVMTVPSLFRGRSFDAVISNPPYRKAGSGRVNPDPEKALARHEIAMTLEGLVRAAAATLKPGGTLTVVMLHERLNEYLALLSRNGFKPSRRREVRSFTASPPILFLLEARLGEAVLETLPPLILKSSQGGDSDEFKSLMAAYGL